ncbi:MAG: enoyl-CoA hydratase-related protein [Candidatus Thermoplasmatota archaeon]|nr:enoyl-CoA hydratase-related protein [Candidatus Thermoplasmatota archaeon]
MAPQHIRLEEEDGLVILYIDRQEALNALNIEVLSELREALLEVEKREDLRILILTGAGDRAFVAGADIREMLPLTPLQTRRFASLGHEVTRILERMEKPVIAAINGFALGGGCELALACDIRIASEGAKIGLPEVGLGIFPGFGGTQRLTRLVGRGWASELIFTADPVDAEMAERIGLVNRVVPREKLLDMARALGRRIIERGPLALSLAKTAIQQSQETGLSSGLAYEMEAFSLIFSTDDEKEGLRAFIEKRKPIFRGE